MTSVPRMFFSNFCCRSCCSILLLNVALFVLADVVVDVFLHDNFVVSSFVLDDLEALDVHFPLVFFVQWFAVMHVYLSEARSLMS